MKYEPNGPHDERHNEGRAAATAPAGHSIEAAFTVAPASGDGKRKLIEGLHTLLEEHDALGGALDFRFGSDVPRHVRALLRRQPDLYGELHAIGCGPAALSPEEQLELRIMHQARMCEPDIVRTALARTGATEPKCGLELVEHIAKMARSNRDALN
jgi:hypothetical protein